MGGGSCRPPWLAAPASHGACGGLGWPPQPRTRGSAPLPRWPTAGGRRRRRAHAATAAPHHVWISSAGEEGALCRRGEMGARTGAARRRHHAASAAMLCRRCLASASAASRAPGAGQRRAVVRWPAVRAGELPRARGAEGQGAKERRGGEGQGAGCAMGNGEGALGLG